MGGLINWGETIKAFERHTVWLLFGKLMEIIKTC